MTKPIDRKDAEDIQRKIKRAFPEAIFSGPITSVDGLPNQELDEQQALFSALRGRKWSEVPGSIIEGNPNGLVLLTDDAFQAFLPAWLIGALAQEEVLEMMLYLFSPESHTSLAMMNRRMQRLNSRQKEAIRALLLYCAEAESSTFVKKQARKAIDYVETFTTLDR